MGFTRSFCLIALLAQPLLASPVQVPLQEQSESGAVQEHISKKRPLHGRFLHITDFHPDRFYEIYSSTKDENACHRGQGPAGIYGAETSDCDSPISLINKTMDWVAKEFKDKIDFVIWTGDSARHDNDEDIPRNEKQVIGLNQFMVDKMSETFGKDKKGDHGNPNNAFVVPIVPTFGNNDILPHNIFRKGPNKWTRTYANMWRKSIPEVQKHQFEQGGWFYVEVIPNKLAIFSLNTMYFFTSNAAADGCAIKSEPGYQQMEWLRIQLQFMRERGMKAILTGHVPPARQDSKTSWEETCWQKYTLWLRQFRDVIVSSHYGHFNYDHFILQDFEDLRKGTKRGRMPDYTTLSATDDDLHAEVSSSYFVELREAWSKLPDPPKSLKWMKQLHDELTELRESDHPFSHAKNLVVDLLKSKKKKRKEQKKFLRKIGGKYAERYSASFVSASVVPNLFPTFRVYEYDVTGLDGSEMDEDVPPPAPMEEAYGEDDEIDAEKKKKKHKKKKYKFEVPKSPSKSSPPGPAYSPQTFSLIRFTQYLANLTHINNDFQASSMNEIDRGDEFDSTKWNEGKHKGKKPHNKDHTPNPKKFKFEVHYDTKHDDVYKLKDLTMPSIIDLATRIGNFDPDYALSPEGEEEASYSESELSDNDVDADRKKKKKKKHKKKKKKKKRKQNEAWFTFVRRAFVETMSAEDLNDEFGD